MNYPTALRVSLAPLFIALLFVLGSVFSASGQTLHHFTIHFDTDRDVLTAEAAHSIDSVLGLLNNIPAAYKVNISGHTDDVGSPEYNMALSKRRTQQAKTYLLAQGFNAKKFQQESRGLYHPATDNGSDQGRSINRRVEIDIAINEIDVSKALGFSVETQTVTFDAAKGTSFTHASGSEIIVPANAFMDVHGQPVSGEVAIEYREYRNPLDFIVSGIPMSQVNGNPKEHFSSAGMFELRAFQNNSELAVANGSALDVNFALVDANMPNVNFYQLDEKGEWATQTAVTNSEGNPVSGNETALDVHGGDFNCYMDECAGRVFAVEKGLELTKAGTNIDLNRMMESFCNVDPDTVRGNVLQSRFALNTTKRNRKKHTFSVIGQANDKHPMATLENVIWQHLDHKTEAVERYLEMGQGSECTVSKNEETDEYTLAFITSTGAPVTLNVVPIAFTNRKSGKKGTAKYTSYAFTQYKSALKRWDKQLEKQKSQTRRQALANAFNQCEMKLQCFWEYNRFYMTNEEASLSPRKWFEYFNENPESMRVRYENIDANPDRDLASCRAIVERQAAIQADYVRAQEIELAATQATNAAFEAMQITNTGIFNYDAVKQLQKPVEALVDYVADNGNKIEPVLIYMQDSQINGAIKYNGSGGYSPYNFAYSPHSEVTIIAFDEDGVAYGCNAATFEAATAKNNRKFQVPLKSLKDIKDMESLRLATK